MLKQSADGVDTTGDISHFGLVTDGIDKVLRTVGDSNLYLQEVKKKPKGGRHIKQRPQLVDEDSDSLGSLAPQRMASKAKTPLPRAPQDRLSDDERSTTTDTIETRHQAPLPSRARKTEHSLKRRRTDRSDDEGDTPVPATSQSMPSVFATTSHSSTRPTIPTSAAARPLSRNLSHPVRPSGAVRSSIGPMSSRTSSHPPNVLGPANSNFSNDLPRPSTSRFATRTTGAPSPMQRYPVLGYPRSAHTQGLLPVAEDSSHDVRHRGFRPPPDRTFTTNANMPNRRFASDPSLVHRMPYTNQHHHGMGLRAPQSNYLMPAARIGHRRDDRAYDGMLEPQSQNPYDGEYGEYGDDGQMAWDHYDDGNYHVGYD